ncbi:pentapeptide repeat-containing protein [Actinomadura sp. DC4]|uniref:pentapeptide repeat-containing protein n=1 Tax=Actinomadura sp. DC4 TaxID=3055069 RepID=UPI0025B0C3D4|nr:pentapeptide repeat-containing protein [Actinomadura sp. DC4]MDN3359543.1 pentapeptide repeat-containing protein [Actinomadura sp. DC4]
MLVVSVAGAVVVAVGLLYTARTYRLSHRGQVTDRFTKALERLSSSGIDARLGGIYTLAHVADDSRPHHNDVVEVLEAFICHRTPTAQPSRLWPHDPPLPDRPATDVQAALTALASRPHRPERRRLDLSGRQLTGARLAGLVLHGANLQGVVLRYADLHDADLRYADLRNADLRNADLRNVNLVSADLRDADLRNANLSDANLSNANLSNANLLVAYLGGADLGGTHLIGTNLGGADLSGTDLRGADLCGAHLGGAHVISTDLRGADIEGADLSNANLRSAHLIGAKNLPAGLHVPQDWTVFRERKSRISGRRWLRHPPGSCTPSR